MIRSNLDIPPDCPDDVEPAMAFLRRAGHSKIDCISVLCLKFGRSLADAKTTVHNSPAWSDLRERDERFWDDLESGLGELD